MQVEPVKPVSPITDRNYSRHVPYETSKKKENKSKFNILLEEEMKKYALSVSTNERT
jgi:hypothetical protein